jgi:hypothetical protein
VTHVRLGIPAKTPQTPVYIGCHSSIDSIDTRVSTSTPSLTDFPTPMIGNLHMSPCRRYTVPTSPTLPYASLRRDRRARTEQIPLVACRTSFTMPSSTKLVVTGSLERFPLGKSNFRDIRGLPGLAYFDKTEYIPKLENRTDVQLFCRPGGFGKSLTVTMLRCFHGFQFRKHYDKIFKVCGCGMLLG